MERKIETCDCLRYEDDVLMDLVFPVLSRTRLPPEELTRLTTQLDRIDRGELVIQLPAGDLWRHLKHK